MTLKLRQRRVFGIDLENYKIDKRIEEKLVGGKSEEEVLVFGSIDGVYFFDGKIVKKIAEREASVRALEVFGGRLYDAGYYNEIRRTMDNEVAAERDDAVMALKVFGGELYDATYDGKIRITMKDRVVVKMD
jgi:hypothetical protein